MDDNRGENEAKLAAFDQTVVILDTRPVISGSAPSE
jgi:hypothetical protein